MVPTPRFVGREDDLVELHERLRRARLVSVLGPPGAGKTRLGLEYAQRHGGAFLAEGAGGVWFCDLSEARDTDDVFRAVAQALDLPLADEPTQRQAADRIASALAARGPTLLILDDVERAHLDLAAAAAARRGERAVAEGLERAARERLERARGGDHLPRRPAPERLATRLLEHALVEGPPPPSRELTPAASVPDAAVGLYELLCEIAAGGMATVYVGRQRGAGGFHRLVAIKRMHPHLASVPDLAAAFMNEARIASLVHHPNVVAVQDVHESRGEYLLVMDYVDGTSLAQLMASAAAAKQLVPRPAAWRRRRAPRSAPRCHLGSASARAAAGSRGPAPRA